MSCKITLAGLCKVLVSSYPEVTLCSDMTLKSNYYGVRLIDGMIQLLLGDVGPLTVGHTRKRSLGSWKSKQMRRSTLAALQKPNKNKTTQQQQNKTKIFSITPQQLFVSDPQLKP